MGVAHPLPGPRKSWNVASLKRTVLSLATARWYLKQSTLVKSSSAAAGRWAVCNQPEGNPLFVTEVVQLLVQEGELTRDQGGQRRSWSGRIPEVVREVIERRLNRLSARCNQTLTTA